MPEHDAGPSEASISEAAGPLDNPPGRRHPDCPLVPSLVVSRIAPTSRGSTHTGIGVRTLRGQSWLAFGCLIIAMLVMCACEEIINYPAPTITSLSPNRITAGSPQSYLTINGQNLIQQTEVGYATAPNSSPNLLVTFNYVSTNQIVVTLPATLLQNPNTL